MLFNRRYSLWKSRGILKSGVSWFDQYGQNLSDAEKTRIDRLFRELDSAILAKDKTEANRLARELEHLSKEKFKRPAWRKAIEFCLALGGALILATIVRQSWWELYQIPTGSMRPAFKEQEALLVSKTTYGLNVPLETQHFLFDEKSVVRGNPVIWSGDKIDLPDVDTLFFGIFPYKKRFVKRMIGKPGDTLYFYGGQAYGVDAEGNDLTMLRDHQPEHIPFRDFEGQVSLSNSPKQIYFRHFGKPIGRVTISRSGALQEEVLNDTGTPFYTTYGMGNFAKARLLTPEQANQFYPDLAKKQEGTLLYLQLQHHPSLKSIAGNQNQPFLHGETSLLPLDQNDLDQLMKGMYTSRFDVQGGRVRNYDESSPPMTTMNPNYSAVPDGRYEFIDGTAYSIGFKGIETTLPKDNPIYAATPENVQKLFNYGINFYTFYTPQAAVQPLPARFAYFREGDFYVMGSPLYKKGDPKLEEFIASEKRKADRPSYVPFLDAGVPSKETILTYGIKVPEKHYLVLGDNHANSADSRYFGFVPEENLQGTPTFVFWPPGKRWGDPNQFSTPWITTPNLIVFTIVSIALLAWWLYRREMLKRKVYK